MTELLVILSIPGIWCENRVIFYPIESASIRKKISEVQQSNCFAATRSVVLYRTVLYSE